MSVRSLRWWAALLVFISLVSSLSAQEAATSLDMDQRVILEAINSRRLRENLVHLVPDVTLNKIAQQYVDDLMARPIDNLGDVYLLRDGRNIEDLLRDEGVNAYTDGYSVDFIPIIVRDFDPMQIVDFWINDFISDAPVLQSRRNVRFGEPGLPFFSPRPREIGIAHEFNATTQRHFYALIFVAEPNELPVIVAERNAVSKIATSVSDPDIILYIHDERVNRFGAGDDQVGAIQRMVVSETSGELDCNNPDDPEWLPYEIEYPWTLSAGSGTKVISVQLCDDFARSVTSVTQVELIDSSDMPDIAGAVRATQTTAAQATSFAPYLPTVEYALTSTAQAQATPLP